MKRDLTVLLAGHLPWWKGLQTPHYVANLLAQRVRVLYVEPRIAWNRASAAFSVRKNLSMLSGFVKHPGHNVWVLTPPALPLGRLQPVRRMNDRLFLFSIKHALRSIGVSRVVLWLAETDNSPLLAALFPQEPKIFHAIDYFVDDGAARTALRLADHATLVLAASPLIARCFEKTPTPTYVFRNGWDETLISNAPARVPSDLETVPRPRLGLVSYLSSNLNYNLLHYLVDHLPVQLVLIGRPIGLLSSADRRLLEALLRKDRVFWLGEKATECLGAYIREFDVCIAPYKNNERIYVSDPLKIYQYLAFGKPVVSTPVSVLEHLEPLVRIGATDDEFIAQLELSLESCSDQESARRRREYADAASWQRRWEALGEVLAGDKELADLAPEAGRQKNGAGAGAKGRWSR